MNAWRRGGGRGRGTQDVASCPCWLEPRPDSGREGGKGEGRIGGQFLGVTGDPLPTSARQVPHSASSSLAESREETGKEDPAETAYGDACRRRGATAGGPRCSKPNCRRGRGAVRAEQCGLRP